MSTNDRIIQDGNTTSQESTGNNETILVASGTSTTVDGAPVITIDDDNVDFRVDGSAATTGATSTVVVEGSNARIDTGSEGSISAEGTGVEITSSGDANVFNAGEITGDVNGVNFANGGTSEGGIANRGTISSDSRAVNIGGTENFLNNFGDIVGTGDQRNGTIYTDGSADDYSINNTRTGTIDAGEGNNGAGIALQTGNVDGDVVSASLLNDGTIDGRGQAAPTGGTAGDGVRIFSSVEDATFQGNIVNNGTISSESAVGPTGGVRVTNGVNFDGRIDNGVDGTIEGVNNGLYFGTGDHDATVVNRGTISSDSRAVNIDGSGVTLSNFGTILGTDDQRNGTVYADGTADEYVIRNRSTGTIDAGEGNEGAGIALETGDEAGDIVTATVSNSGTITGRGDAAATGGTAGDGVRIFAGAENATFSGNVINRGTISAESDDGTTAGVRIANGVNFDGNVSNFGGATISGTANGVYFGTGSHDAEIINRGTISSDSRAVNIDGTGVTLNNTGTIIGTGDQRNGTVYADGTADEYSITNSGVIDAGAGNDGSGISLQTGDVANDTVTASVINNGIITGRGDAQVGNGIGDGIRVFSGVEGATFSGDIVNNGTIAASTEAGPAPADPTFTVDVKDASAPFVLVPTLSNEAVGIRIEDGVTLDGTIVNTGRITAEDVAIDASDAGGSVDIVNTGRIDGAVVLSEGDDSFDGSASVSDTDVEGGGGDDLLVTGLGDDFLVGGLGSDSLDGGAGDDVLSFDDVDVPVTVDVAAGTATRDTGFTVEVEGAPFESLTTGQSPRDLVLQALDGNLYFNVHTNDFSGGEIRGQLEVVSDDSSGSTTRTIILSGSLDSSQEPGPTSDSDATGEGTVTILIENGVATYSSSLTITGLAPSDLLPVAGASSIHLHNAPAGSNGPIITDIIQDAGGDVEGNALTEEADSGDGNVFAEVSETDTFANIETVIGSSDGDLLQGSSASNTLLGGDGDDILAGRGGTDVIDGGAGFDINSFEGIGLGVRATLSADGTGTAQYGGVNESFTGIEGLLGSDNDDELVATGAAANSIDGGAGDDFIAGGGGTDTLDGGEGNDTNSFQGIGFDVVANLGNGTASYQTPGGTVFENFSNFENLDGSSNDDQLTGDGGSNVLTGQLGDDLLSGGGGSDTLEGGDGDDILQGGGGSDVTDGGAGIDTASFADIGPDVSANLGSGQAFYTAPSGAQIVDTLIDIENLTGSASNDSLAGNAEDNLLAGGQGDDVLIGRLGNDVLRGDAVGDGEAITVTVTNTLDVGGTFLTPVWFGFHDGSDFDLFTEGEAASLGLERLAEDGVVTGIAAEFNQQVGSNGVDATIFGGDGVPGIIDPGETASFTINVNAADVGQGFFTWGTMVIASNDAFLASPDNALEDFIFDSNGNFVGPITIQRFGSDVLDAGTEVNTELDAAFINQSGPDQGIAENGVVGAHIGFNGSEGNPDGGPVNILGGTSAAGTLFDPTESDFTRNGGAEQLLEIVIDRAVGGRDSLNGGAGDDILEGGGGSDILTGGDDADTFVFSQQTAPSRDTITDFEDGTDLIDVTAFGVINLNDFDIVTRGDDTVVEFADNNTVRLLDFQGTLDEDDFVFQDNIIW